MDDYRKAAVDPKMMQLLCFAEQVARDASAIDRDQIARLRAAGFSDRAILDAAHVAGFFCYMNRVVQALGADTNPANQIRQADAGSFSSAAPAKAMTRAAEGPA